MMMPDGMDRSPALQEAMRELEAAIHDARVAFDCIGLGELNRAHTSAVTARIAVDAAVIAMQAEIVRPNTWRTGGPGHPDVPPPMS